MSWEVVIGLEVHVQLATQSKIFSGAATAYGAAPNTQACAVDLGLPGVLPVLNARAVEMAVRFGLAVDAQIAPRCVFARKHYFYPDLPKGYQISQYELPIVAHGHLDIVDAAGNARHVRILRAHLIRIIFRCLKRIEINRRHNHRRPLRRLSRPLTCRLPQDPHRTRTFPQQMQVRAAEHLRMQR